MTIPTSQLIDFSLMKGSKIKRCFSESFLESFNVEFEKFFGKITDAATTGPDKQPLPASSQPTSINPLE